MSFTPFLYENLKISATRDANPDTGASYVWVYAGTQAQMDAVELYWSQLNVVTGTPTGRGYKTTKNRFSGGCTLTLRFPDDQLYTDRWGLDTESVAVDPFWTPQIRSYLPSMATLDLTNETDFRTFMRQVGLMYKAASLLADGIDPNTVTSILPAPIGFTCTREVYDILHLFVKESRTLELKRPVLKRNRTVPYLTGTSTPLIGPQYVYTSTEALDDSVGNTIPSDIYTQIYGVFDNLPTTYPKFKWGWKERRQDQDVQVGFARTVECKDWVFGNWSTITHIIVS